MDDTQSQSWKDNPRYRGLKPFQKGQSGNPGGMPKGVSIVKAIRRHLRLTMAELAELVKKGQLDNLPAKDYLAIQAIIHAGQGRSSYFRTLLDHVDGRPVIRIEQTKPADELAGMPDDNPAAVSAGLEAYLKAMEKGGHGS